MTSVFEKSDEWGGFTVKPDPAGFLIEFHTHVEGEINGLTILVPYGTWGFGHDINLNAPHKEMPTNGEALAEMAMSDAKLPVEDRTVVVLDEGGPLDASKRKEGPKKVSDHFSWLHRHKEVTREQKHVPGGERWYTLSRPKDDETGYGRCHDLFTEMYLTHGLPQGMALWTTSDFDTEENRFFAEIPAGIDVTGDPFFTDLPFMQCDAPSRTGLLMLVGHFDEPPKAKSPRRRSRLWRRHEAAA